MISAQQIAQILIEGGASQEYGIWYHGTSMRLYPAIRAEGLVPNPKVRAWGSDPDVSAWSVSRASYGGIYVAQNLMTALSSGWRLSRTHKTNQLLVIMRLQARSLVADEDAVNAYAAQISTQLSGSAYHALYPYKMEVYGPADEREKEWADDYKKKWVEDKLALYFYQFKLQHPALKQRVRELLANEGYRAMLTRLVAYQPKEGYSRHDWDRLWNYKDVPPLPTPEEGERGFVQFVDKLTRTLKHKARHTLMDYSFSRTARSMEPISYSGRNRIIALLELVTPTKEQRDSGDYSEKIRILYNQEAELPQDFIQQWEERVGKGMTFIE